jgi:FAD/FMN-containing dehydrogenase
VTVFDATDRSRALRGLDSTSVLVLRPGDDGYDEARQSFNGMIDRKPAVIVQPASTDDVAAAVRSARAAGLPIGVRGGGHSVSGQAFAEDALVVDLRRMRSVSVDPERRIARAQGGALWEDVDGATVPHSLFVPGGTFVDTGIGGLTLTGGIGFLMGTGGLTCDNLVAATVVTADRSVVVAGEDGDPELLWALRGGGGNFGVVTEFVFGLHPLGEIHVGAFAVPLADAATGLERVAAIQRDAPPELLFMIVGPTTETRPENDAEPDGPRDWVRLFGVYHGPLEAAEAAMAPLRALPNLSGDIVPITYPELQAVSGLMPFGLRHYWKGHFVRDLDESAIAATVAGMASATGQASFLLLEAITGRGRMEPDGGAAFGQREARWNASALAIWEDPADDDAQMAWARRVAGDLEASSLTGAGYGNYAPIDETAERVRRGFGDERFERLARVKRRYDPDNVFRFNHNIPPATGG